MPNTFAHLVLYGWPFIAAALFWRIPLTRALPWAIVSGYLFLPNRFGLNLPLLPTWERNLAAAVAALLLCLTLDNGRDERSATWRAQGWLPKSPVARALLLLFFIQPIATVLTNLDSTMSGGRRLPGMSPVDIGAAFYGSMTAAIPYLLARRYLACEDGRVAALAVLAVAGLCYSVLVAYEIRFSPQIHSMLYGYRAFDWIQQLRDGGFRPVVFQQHGLWTAIFMATAVIAAAAIWRSAEPARRLFWAGATLWLGMVLALSNSLGALMLAAAMVPVARFAPTRLQLTALALVGWIVLLYPMLRSIDVVPIRSINAAAEAIDPGRAASLRFRFDNEDILLDRANDRPLFGWGGWGRGRIYDEEGGRVSVTDGRWIITFGNAGWAGYVAEFGLLTLPLILCARRRAAPSPAAIGLGLALAANLLDMIPNGTLTPVTWLLAGAMLGWAEQQRDALDPSIRKAATGAARRRRLRPVIGGEKDPCTVSGLKRTNIDHA